ncbi:hypothetical protein J6590_053107 [Homalodisca vitripennis]|nr:hypothetical protein J6590_053107 [Homalodisca vitripennis]
MRLSRSVKNLPRCQENLLMILKHLITTGFITGYSNSRVLRNSGLDTEQDEDCRDRKRVIISVYERFRVHMDIDERHEPSKRKKMFVVNSLTLSRDRCDRRSCRTLVSFRESRRYDVTLSCLL